MPTISSRTPEGEPFHCRVCGNDVTIEPSVLAYDAPCPVCGTFLWLSRFPQLASFLKIDELSQERREWIMRFLAEFNDADSVDRSNLLMEFEDQFHLYLPQELADEFKSIDDVIDWWIERENER